MVELRGLFKKERCRLISFLPEGRGPWRVYIFCDVLLYLAKRHFFSQASGLPPALDTFESCSTTFISSVQRVACSGWHCFNDSCVFISLIKLSFQVFSRDFWEAIHELSLIGYPFNILIGFVIELFFRSACFFKTSQRNFCGLLYLNVVLSPIQCLLKEFLQNLMLIKLSIQCPER